MREPFNKSFEEIASYTDDQIAGILFHPRNDDGTLKVEDEPEESRSPRQAMSFRQMTYTVWRKREPEITEEELAKRFKEKYPGVR